MPLRARAFDFSQHMRGSSGTLRKDEYNRTCSINRVNDCVGVERAGSYISRRDPTFHPFAFERHDSGICNGGILRGVTYKEASCAGTSADRLHFFTAFSHV
jgi:hypothetical protein